LRSFSKESIETKTRGIWNLKRKNMRVVWVYFSNMEQGYRKFIVFSIMRVEKYFEGTNENLERFNYFCDQKAIKISSQIWI